MPQDSKVVKLPPPKKPKTPKAEPAAPKPEREFAMISIERIIPSTYKVRQTLNQSTIDSIAASIPEYGIIEPLVVRETEAGYMIIAGEHRFYAAKKAKLKQLPCMIDRGAPARDYVKGLVENINRADVNAAEIALALKALRDGRKWRIDDIAKRLGKSPAWVSNHLRLLDLPLQLIDAIDRGLLDQSKGLLILQLPKEKQEEIGTMIIDHNMSYQAAQQTIKDVLSALQPQLAPPPAGEPRQTEITPLRKCYYCLESKDARQFIFVTACSDCAKLFPAKKGLA